MPGRALRTVRPVELVDTERRRIALDLLADVRRVDNQLEELTKRIAVAVTASGTTVSDVYGGRSDRRGVDTPGRVYFERKLAEGKTRKEALRASKRRTSDAVNRQLVIDTRP